MSATTERFPRASRDSCLRSHDAIAGPFYDVEKAGHRAVMLVSVIGLVAVVGAILLGVL